MIPELRQQAKSKETAARLPYVSLIISFEPRKIPKEKIQQQLNAAIWEVERELSQNISKYVVKSAIAKLKSIINNLDYNWSGKGVAIFLSPFAEEVIYLHFAVAKKVLVGQILTMNELLQQKRQEKEYLVVELKKDNAVFYMGQGYSTKLIVNNSVGQLSLKYGLPSPRQFKKYVDHNLKLILRAWKLPVIVIGSNNELSDFMSQTAHNADIIKCICVSDILNSTLVDQLIAPVLNNWPALKENYLLKQLDKAINKNRADVGIDNVWQASIQKRNNLLLVEEGFSYHSYSSSDDLMQYADAIPMHNSVVVEDAVQNIIEKVLAGGGDVEYVSKGRLDEHLHIALFRY